MFFFLQKREGDPRKKNHRKPSLSHLLKNPKTIVATYIVKQLN